MFRGPFLNCEPIKGAAALLISIACGPTSGEVYSGSTSGATVILGGGARGSVVVKALCCKPEGRGFKYR
jgi:hypothetical protein